MEKENKKKKKLNSKPIIISVIIVAAVGYLIFSGLRDTMTYYMTVSEVLAQTGENRNEALRLGGIVQPDSVDWNPKSLNLSFTIKEEGKKIKVGYQGVVPDSFKPGIEVIVEGLYNGNGQFTASQIMPKCASKYE